MKRLLQTVFVLALLVCESGMLTRAVAQSPKEITNSIGMKLVLIPTGTFTMGSPPEEKNVPDDEEQHQVAIGKEYYLGMTEVTQGQYEKVMGSNPSYFPKQVVRNNGNSDSSMHPVQSVSWEDAVKFCERLTERPDEKKADRIYRLPTEAEWEYACRASSKTAYSFGEDPELLGDYAWFLGNSNRQTHPVGEKKPNAWGLYDMHGNVWEWCSDWYGEYPKGALVDPVGPSNGSFRVCRGGSHSIGAAFCRSADRRGYGDITPRRNYSFRVAMSPSEVPK